MVIFHSYVSLPEGKNGEQNISKIISQKKATKPLSVKSWLETIKTLQ